MTRRGYTYHDEGITAGELWLIIAATAGLAVIIAIASRGTVEAQPAGPRPLTAAECRALDGLPFRTDDGQPVCVTSAILLADSGEAR